MTTEIDLVRGYMQVEEERVADLSRARALLDDAIAGEDLHSAAPPVAAPPRRLRTRQGRSLRWGVCITIGVAAAVIVSVVAVAPPSKTPTAPAAAAEIARLADAAPPVPPLGAGQWYQYQLEGALTATVSSGTKASPISSTATLPITIGEWSNSTTAVCTSEAFGTVSFATPADAQAWQTMGLVTTPSNQPATGCSAGAETASSPGGGGTPLGPIDVSTIAHDPATLVAELQKGTTGIRQVDAYAQGMASPVDGFLRLTALLVGPLQGQWAGLNQELLRTMALLPGIESLGATNSHAGAPGVAFSMAKQVTLNPATGAETYAFQPPTVVLNPQSGDLLEVRNFEYPVLQSAAQDFVGSPSALVFSDGVSYGTTAAWIDPVSGLEVIDQVSVPGWIATYHIIEAVTAPSTSPSQWSNLVSPYLGNGNMDYGDENVPVQGESTQDITIMGSLSTAQSVANALTASGLFVSVSLEL